MIRVGASGGAVARCLLGILMLFYITNGGAWADAVVEVSPDKHVIDLNKTGTRVAAQRRNLALEVPGDTEGQSRVLELRGQGVGPEFNWTIYAIKNTGPDPRDLVLTVDEQGFVESHFWPLRPFGPQISNVQWVPDLQSLNWQRMAGDDNLSFRLAPGASLSIALEGLANVRSVRLVDQGTHSRQRLSVTFLRGAALAVTLMTMLVLLAAYGYRAHRAFLAGSLFSLAGLNFMVLDSGYWSTLGIPVSGGIFSLQNLRACSEAFLALAAALVLWQLTSTKRRTWRESMPFVAMVLGAVASLALAFVEPEWSTAVSRILALVGVSSGFILALWYRGKSGFALRYGVVFWAALSAWTLFAAIAASNPESGKLFHSLMVTGLAVVIAVLGTVLASVALAEGFLSKPMVADAGRRSLALTGAKHFMWDWQPVERKLDVAPELVTSLGYDPNRFAGMSAGHMIESLLNPDDLSVYRQVLDPNGVRAGEFMERELRLMDVRGEYHWFDLRIRGLPGQGRLPGRMIGTLTEITRQKQAEDRLINEAVRDPVTSLPSRALFLDRMDRAIGKPLATPVRALMVGIERFKVVNDGLGHDLGDQILLVAGQRISDCLSNEESVARVSGSQFCVMCLENIDSRDAFSLADEIVAKLATAIPVMNSEVVLSVSIGISRLSSDGYSSLELQKQAATALHEAQSRGTRTILEYDVSLKDERADRLVLENDLRRAIDRREIEVHYQPIVDLETREIVGLEALARWRHPTRGMLPPSDYIGLAEQAGLIGEIGDLILAEAARQMGIWQRVLTRNRPVFVSVNVSSEQLSETTLLDKLAMVIAREGLPPHSLKIELTESVVMRFPERTRLLVERLRSLGVGVACDDFGTGFSNLASLRDLQFDTLKMDRSFIANGALDARGGLILASVIDLANSLGMRVVAEGIENEEQAARLVGLGCNLGQGYFLGEPVPAREVHGLLAVLPVIESPHAQDYGERPMPGVAPMAPRFAEDETFEDIEPEELPSLFAVTHGPPKSDLVKKKPVKKAAHKSANKTRKPAPKMNRKVKAKTPRRK
jgi:diguanylate cyclase (GGDEF)-like protein